MICEAEPTVLDRLDSADKAKLRLHPRVGSLAARPDVTTRGGELPTGGVDAATGADVEEHPQERGVAHEIHYAHVDLVKRVDAELIGEAAVVGTDLAEQVVAGTSAASGVFARNHGHLRRARRELIVGNLYFEPANYMGTVWPSIYQCDRKAAIFSPCSLTNQSSSRGKYSNWTERLSELLIRC